MNPLQQQIQILQNQVQALLEWKRQKEGQQITMPIDQSSQEILNEDAIVFIDIGIVPATPAGTLRVEINGTQYNLITA